MVELLKQDQYLPLPVEEQIVLIFAGTNGYIDNLPVGAVKRFERDLLDFMKHRQTSLLEEVRQKKQIDDDIRGRLKNAIEEFKKGFTA